MIIETWRNESKNWPGRQQSECFYYKFQILFARSALQKLQRVMFQQKILQLAELFARSRRPQKSSQCIKYKQELYNKIFIL